MIKSKRNLTKKIAAGAALVALSGFVPKMSKPAQAASASINVLGSFTSGLKMTAGNDIKFGIIVPTTGNGQATVKTGGTFVSTDGFQNGGAPANGSIKFQAGALKAVDMTMAGLKATLTLGATANGGKTGTVNLPTVSVNGPYAAAEVFKIATTKNTVTLTSTTADLVLGGVVTWGATAPIGTFTTPITLTINY